MRGRDTWINVVAIHVGTYTNVGDFSLHFDVQVVAAIVMHSPPSELYIWNDFNQLVLFSWHHALVTINISADDDNVFCICLGALYARA